MMDMKWLSVSTSMHDMFMRLTRNCTVCCDAWMSICSMCMHATLQALPHHPAALLDGQGMTMMSTHQPPAVIDIAGGTAKCHMTTTVPCSARIHTTALKIPCS